MWVVFNLNQKSNASWSSFITIRSLSAHSRYLLWWYSCNHSATTPIYSIPAKRKENICMNLIIKLINTSWSLWVKSDRMLTSFLHQKSNALKSSFMNQKKAIKRRFFPHLILTVVNQNGAHHPSAHVWTCNQLKNTASIRVNHSACKQNNIVLVGGI